MKISSLLGAGVLVASVLVSSAPASGQDGDPALDGLQKRVMKVALTDITTPQLLTRALTEAGIPGGIVAARVCGARPA